MANLNHYIFLKTTPPCLAGSRAWRLSSGSTACGLRETQIFLLNAWVFVVPLATLTAAAGAFFSYSPISYLKNDSFKSWSSLAATCATSTQNFTANSTLSNNTRGSEALFLYGRACSNDH
jgi:hypothetical protein